MLIFVLDLFTTLFRRSRLKLGALSVDSIITTSLHSLVKKAFFHTQVEANRTLELKYQQHLT